MRSYTVWPLSSFRDNRSSDPGFDVLHSRKAPPFECLPIFGRLYCGVGGGTGGFRVLIGSVRRFSDLEDEGVGLGDVGVFLNPQRNDTQIEGIPPEGVVFYVLPSFAVPFPRLPTGKAPIRVSIPRRESGQYRGVCRISRYPRKNLPVTKGRIESHPISGLRVTPSAFAPHPAS